jgi:hypothetical protein
MVFDARLFESQRFSAWQCCSQDLVCSDDAGFAIFLVCRCLPSEYWLGGWEIEKYPGSIVVMDFGRLHATSEHAST